MTGIPQVPKFEMNMEESSQGLRWTKLAETCEFANKAEEIKSQIIQGCTSRKLRTKCLQEDRSLSELLLLARTMELADRQSKIMEQSPEINKVRQLQKKNTRRMFRKYPSYYQRPAKLQRNKECRNRGEIKQNLITMNKK